MKETKKNAILRVFQTAHCNSAHYIFGVACSSISILLSGIPFYTIYRIVHIFLEASLNNTAVDVSAAWLWAGITLASIVICLSLLCLSCTLWPADEDSEPHGQAEFRLFHRRTVRSGTKDHERQH